MKICLLLLFSIAATSLSSCASDDNYYLKLKKKNEKYSERNARKKARIQARQERTDMWFDRMMH